MSWQAERLYVTYSSGPKVRFASLGLAPGRTKKTCSLLAGAWRWAGLWEESLVTLVPGKNSLLNRVCLWSSEHYVLVEYVDHRVHNSTLNVSVPKRFKIEQKITLYSVRQIESSFWVGDWVLSAYAREIKWREYHIWRSYIKISRQKNL